MEPTFFATPADLRAWFAEHAATATELHVGYWKKGTGRPSVTWPESVDEALCVGWIDGVRHSLGEDSYTIRFTPRRKGSTWSAVNVGRIEALRAEGRMTAAGLAAFEARRDDRTAIYSFEQGTPTLPPHFEQQLRAAPGAGEFFDAQPPGYRRNAIWWVLSAKRETTQQRRFDQLLAASQEGRRLPNWG